MSERTKPPQIQDYKDLTAWQSAMALCERVYRESEQLPEHERFGLTAQMRRAAVSIPANIAEGYGRGSRRDYSRFVRLARASAAELETELLLAHRLGMLSGAGFDDLMRELAQVRQLIQGLVRALDSDR
jgi:four helix bundle protein